MDERQNIVKGLRLFIRGQIDRFELMDYDHLISEIREKHPLGESQIIIEFDNQDALLKFIGMDDNEASDFELVLQMDRYGSGYEYEEPYSVGDSFTEGYFPFDYLGGETIEKFKEVAELFIYPRKKANFNDREYVSEMMTQMRDIFRDEFDEMTYDYASEVNSALGSAIHEEAISYVDRGLKSVGLSEYYDYGELRTTPGHLLSAAAQFNITDIDLTSLLKTILEKAFPKGFDRWLEDPWNYDWSKFFDKGSFDRNVDRTLDEIREKGENFLEKEGVSIDDYIEFKDRILKKYEINKLYQLPKDPTTKFIIKNLILPEFKIELVLFNKEMNQKTLKLSEKNFYNLLHQPTLFDFDEI